MCYIKQILTALSREIVQNNSPRWLETVSLLYFPRLRLGKYSRLTVSSHLGELFCTISLMSSQYLYNTQSMDSF